MISAIHKRLQEREEGFTLIELLVVVIIIGILAAIAIPIFLNQRENAWRRTAQSDLRNNSVVLETNFSETGVYGEAPTALRWSADVDGDLVTGGATYCMEANHTSLPGDVFVLNSANGQVQLGTCAGP